jgi:hypothetical protein
VHRVDISAPTFTYDDDDPARSRSGLFRVGPQLGATQTGTSVYELPAGPASSRMRSSKVDYCHGAPG